MLLSGQCSRAVQCSLHLLNFDLKSHTLLSLGNAVLGGDGGNGGNNNGNNANGGNFNSGDFSGNGGIAVGNNGNGGAGGNAIGGEFDIAWLCHVAILCQILGASNQQCTHCS